MTARGNLAGPGDPVVRTRWSAVVAVSLGVILATLDLTIVAVALPSLGSDFDATPGLTQWVLLTYSIPIAALAIPAGRWLDRAGPLPAFLLAVGGFGIASALIAGAPTFPLLLAGRGMQGMFGSLIGVVGLPIIAASVRVEHRAKAMSIVLTLIPLSGVAGPPLGGLLAEAYGWRSVFLINIPIAVLAAWFARRTIPARSSSGSGLPLPELRLVREAAVLAVAVTALFLSLDGLGRSGGFALPVGLALVTVLATLGWSRLPESRPVRLLVRRRGLGAALVAVPMVTAGAGGLSFLVPYLFTDTLRVSPATIGTALLALAAAMAVFSPLAGIVADRVGHRPVALAGTVVTLGGMVTLLFVSGESTPFDVAWRLALVGAGNGLFAGPNSVAVLEHTPPELMGTSSGVTSLARTLGFALGPALGALAWTAASGGVSGFHAGTAVLTAATVVGIAATLAGRSSRAVSRR